MLRRKFILFIVVFNCQVYCATVAMAKAPWFLWIEAEKFTSATEGIRIKHAVNMTNAASQKNIAEWFARRSGWNPETGQEISNGAYIEQTIGKRYDLTITEQVCYRFDVPSENDYYIWLRCDSPPPCARQFTIWIDTLQQSNALSLLNFSYSDIWSWWPWGKSLNTGKAKPYHLKKGSHVLYVGAMSHGLRLDKILITNDSQYQPFGINQHYYSGSFEPPTIADVHNHFEKGAKVTPTATGWVHQPTNQWEVREEIQNHYYYVRPLNEGTLAYTLIKEMNCDCFKASYKVIFPNENTPDALLVFSFQDPKNYEAVCIKRGEIELRTVLQGQTKFLAKENLVEQTGATRSAVQVDVRRLRTMLSITVDGKTALQVRMAHPRQGGIGLGSFAGGVGFDDVAITPVNDPSASINMQKMDDHVWGDWMLVRSGKRQPWHPDVPLRRNDLLVYNVPFWTNSEVQLSLAPSSIRRFSMFYPYMDEAHFVRTQLDLASSSSLHVERRIGATTESLGDAALNLPTADISIQSGKGLFAVVQNDRVIMQSNEYELLSGTLAFRAEEDGVIPLQAITIIPRQVIADNFDANADGTLLPDWKIENGSWLTRSTLPVQGEDALPDQQLTIDGPGAIRIGAPEWSGYQIQLMANITSQSAFAIDGWVHQNSAIQFFCRPDEVQLRRVMGDNLVTLAATALKPMSSGWHQFIIDYDQNGVRAQVDGVEVLRDGISGFKGLAGLRNYSGKASFDNATIRITNIDDHKNDQIRVVDPLVFEIENELTQTNKLP